MWCSGSTIVGIGSPDPPQFIYDDTDYEDVFLSGTPRIVEMVTSYFAFAYNILVEALGLTLSMK